MKHFARHGRLCWAVAAGLVAVAPALADPSPSAPITVSALSLAPSAASRSLTTQFFYTVTVPAPAPRTKTLDIWLPIPSDSPWQTVTDVTVDTPVPYTISRESKFGNRMVYLHNNEPTDALSATVRFTVARREVRVLDVPAGHPAPSRQKEFPSPRAVLGADKRVPVGGRFQTIARQVTQGQGDTLAQERALFDSVVAIMHYDYKKVSPEYAQGDAAFVCDYKSGNCSDLHSYLISLSRSIGTPAFLEFGFPLSGIPFSGSLPTDGTISGYHCWTWFQAAPGQWAPLDAADARRWDDSGHPEVTRYLFGNLVLERSAVAMSRGRDLTLAPAQQGPPLNYFIYPYAEEDGKATDASWKLTYHVLSQTP